MKYTKTRTLVCACGASFVTRSPRTHGLLCPSCFERRRMERRRYYDELTNQRRRTGRPVGRPRKFPLDYNPLDPPAMYETIPQGAQPGGFAISSPGWTSN